MANVGSGRRAESSHKKRRMNAFTKLIKPPYYALLLCCNTILYVTTILFHTKIFVWTYSQSTYYSPHTLPHQAEEMATRSKLSGAEFSSLENCRRIKTHSHAGQTVFQRLPSSTHDQTSEPFWNLHLKNGRGELILLKKCTGPTLDIFWHCLVEWISKDFWFCILRSYFTLQLQTHKAKRLKYVIFRGSLLGAHGRGHPLLPRVPHPSPHHRQPAVGSTPTSRGGVCDRGLDHHLHHLHLPHPALLHHPPPVVSGVAKLVKRLWSQVTCKRHHTQMPIADNSVLLWSHPPQEPPPTTTTTTITTTAVKKNYKKWLTSAFHLSLHWYIAWVAHQRAANKGKGGKVKLGTNPGPARIPLSRATDSRASSDFRLQSLWIQSSWTQGPLNRWLRAGPLSRCSRSAHWPWQAAKGRKRPWYPFLLHSDSYQPPNSLFNRASGSCTRRVAVGGWNWG